MSADLHPTAQQLCAVGGVSRRMFHTAVKVCREGRDELTDLVKAADGSKNPALALARFDNESQSFFLANFPTIKPHIRAGLMKFVRLCDEQEKPNGERSQ